MLELRGLLLSPPGELPPSGNFTTPTQLVSVFDESAGEVFKLTATDEAAAALADAKTPCPVALASIPHGHPAGASPSTKKCPPEQGGCGLSGPATAAQEDSP